MEEIPGIFTFVGRFHPLFVHLPIGFLSVIIIYELIPKQKQLKKLAPVINMTWLLAAISALISVLLGLLLSSGGGYDAESLLLHKWWAIILTILCIAGYWITRNPRKSPLAMGGYKTLVIGVAISWLITGHMGGSLTHGAGYLFEFEKKFGERPVITSLDSADVFADAVAPILHTKCSGCHNKQKRKGQLMMTSYESIMKGGKSGPAIVAGKPADSELYVRVTLPHDDEKFMPSEGKKPLTEEQLAIIKWWIAAGAPEQATITSLSPDRETVERFQKYFKIGQPTIADVPAADTAEIKVLTSYGFDIRIIARNGNWLEARLRQNKNGKEGIDALEKINEQLLWLYLNKSNLHDDDLHSLSKLSHLRKLNLSNNPITDKCVSYLTQLKELEYLNLYDTKVSDAGVDSLLVLPNLKEIYLWQTKVTQEHMEQCIAEYPNLKIICRTPE